MSKARPAHTVIVPQSISRRLVLHALAALVLAPKAALSFSLFGASRMNSPETDAFKWDVDFCSYGIDINPRANGLVETLADDNWLRDAQGNTVALFFTGFGAAWGSGASPMGGPPFDENTRLPLSLRLSYYDYVEDRFYQLNVTLPLKKIHALFVQQTMNKREERQEARFETLRIGVAPQGYIMIWATGLAAGDQVELMTDRATVIPGMTMQTYLKSLGQTGFKLDPNRFRALSDARFTQEDIARIKAGWRADPIYYMRTIRVKYPWRYRLTGQARTMVELESYEGNSEAQSVGAWEMSRYQMLNAMRAVPETAKFWFLDPSGQHHHLWISFSLRERAVSEADLSEVRAAFEQIFPKRTLEDNGYLPSDQDMATVEVHASEDFKTFAATLVKGDVRLPLPVGKTQYFPLRPNAYWPGTDGPEPKMLKLFKEGPPA